MVNHREDDHRVLSSAPASYYDILNVLAISRGKYQKNTSNASVKSSDGKPVSSATQQLADQMVKNRTKKKILSQSGGDTKAYNFFFDKD